MSFDLIFFNNNLYHTANLDTEVPRTAGENKSGILVICTEFSNAALQEFLSKILQAVNTNLQQDVWVVDVSGSKMPHWAELVRTVACKKAIIFGVNPSDLGLHLRLPAYQVQGFNGCDLLLADSLKIISEDKNKKALLWRELQQLF